jgi:hypothetical protein
MAHDDTIPLQGTNAGAGGTPDAWQEGSQPLQDNTMNDGEGRDPSADLMHRWQSEALEEAPQEARMLALADDRHMPNAMGEWHAALLVAHELDLSTVLVCRLPPPSTRHRWIARRG